MANPIISLKNLTITQDKNTIVKNLQEANQRAIEAEEKLTAARAQLEIAKKKQKSKNKSRSYSSKYGKGALRDHIRPYIEPLKVGDVACIPISSFDLTAIATASASYAHQLFGKGGHIGRTDQKNQVFEIMRLET